MEQCVGAAKEKPLANSLTLSLQSGKSMRPQVFERQSQQSQQSADQTYAFGSKLEEAD